VARAGRRVALALAGASALLGAAIVAGSPRVPTWIAAGLGGLGLIGVAGLLADLLRPRR
jgi:hypothetical protein